MDTMSLPFDMLADKVLNSVDNYGGMCDEVTATSSLSQDANLPETSL